MQTAHPPTSTRTVSKARAAAARHGARAWRAIRSLARRAIRARARLHRPLRDETGAATAEYAVVILAAVALAGALVVIMRSSEVQAMLLELVERAFNAAG